LGILAALFLYLPLFPSLSQNDEMQKLLQLLPAELVNTIGFADITTGSGYTQATFFGLMGFALFSIAAVSWGTAAIAGAEEQGMLEITLAHSVSRSRYLIEASISVIARIIWLGIVVLIVLLSLNAPAELGLEHLNIIAAVCNLVALALCFAMVAVLVGSLGGGRGLTLGIAATSVVLSFALNALANQTAQAKFLYAISPYSWAYRNEPLKHGFELGSFSLLLGLSVLCFVLSLIALNRRDAKG
ncbi:MAG: ABC transporter permease subunit, partial [Microbacteriaceae bacterium]